MLLKRAGVCCEPVQDNFESTPEASCENSFGVTVISMQEGVKKHQKGWQRGINFSSLIGRGVFLFILIY